MEDCHGNFFQVPDETLATLPVFMVLAGIGFGWKNYSSIQIYQEEKIVLHCPKMSVTIVGKALQIICLNEDEVMIEGYIEHIEYR
ncbi:MAG: YabP/YqfC family sporulation protein [Coprococcus sp.]